MLKWLKEPYRSRYIGHQHRDNGDVDHMYYVESRLEVFLRNILPTWICGLSIIAALLVSIAAIAK